MCVYIPYMQVFGERLKELRTGKGLTQKQPASLMNVSGNAVHAWESDKQEPSLAMLVRLAEYFEASTDYLLGRTDY